MFLPSQKSKCQDLANFSFPGKGGALYQIPEQGVLANLSRNFALPLSGSPCITDSLSHTTYVETKKSALLYENCVVHADEKRRNWGYYSSFLL